ncbi:MAG: hypothetical protein ACTHK7_02485, partial [Aureliella sp.]
LSGATASSVSASDQIREMLRLHVKRAGRLIKLLDLATYLIAWLAGMLAAWLVVCLAEHWIVPLGSVARWGAWLGLVAVTVWGLLRYVVPLAFRRINPDYVAQRIEQAEPDLKSGLLSWLQLESLPNNGVPRGIMAGLARHAARYIHPEDPSASVDMRGVIKLVGGTLLLLMTLIVYGMVSPKSAWVTGQRLFMPWASIAPPSRVQLVSLKPGSTELTQGRPLAVDVELRGLRLSEPVRVRYSTLDGQLRDQVKELAPVTEGYHYTGLVETAQAGSSPGHRGVQHELDYWIEAGDLVSGPHRVTLSRLPAVSLESVHIAFPPYTKLSERSLTGGEFEAIEGSVATIRAVANQPLSRGRIEVDPELDAQGNLLDARSLLEMQVSDRQLAGDWRLRVNAAGDNPTLARYRIRGFNERGDANEDPIEYKVRILADVPPEVSIPGPENRTLRMLPNGQMNIEVRASDPDFGLSRLQLEVTRYDMLAKQVVLLESEGIIGRQVKAWRFRGADFQARVGDRFIFTAIAEDNRHHPATGEPAPNTAQSEALTVEIVAPEKFEATDEAHKAPSPPEDDQNEPKRNERPDGGNSKSQDVRNQDGQNADRNTTDQQEESSERPGDSGKDDKQAAGQRQGKGKLGSENDSSGSESGERGEKSQQGKGGESQGDKAGDKSGDQAQGDKSQGDKDQSQSGGAGASGKGQSGGSRSEDSKSGSGGSGQSGDQSSQQRDESGNSNSSGAGSKGSSSKGGSGNWRSGQGGGDESASDAGEGDSSSTSSGGRQGQRGSRSGNRENAGGAGGKPTHDGDAFERISEYMRDHDQQRPNNQP